MGTSKSCLKAGMSAELPSRKREENLRFFARSHTKIHRKQTLLWKVWCKSPKISTLATTEFGGTRYATFIGISRGPPTTRCVRHMFHILIYFIFSWPGQEQMFISSPVIWRWHRHLMMTRVCLNECLSAPFANDEVPTSHLQSSLTHPSQAYFVTPSSPDIQSPISRETRLT